MSILIRNGTIITLGRKNRVLEGYALLIEGERIMRIAPQRSFDGNYATVIDASGKVVMPGFINAHMHFYSTMARGLSRSKPSKDFVGVLKNLWWRLDKRLTPRDVYFSALIAMINAIKHGTTTLIDHHASPFAVRGSLFEIARAASIANLRVSCCYEISDRDGSLIRDEGLRENEEFLRWVKERRSEYIKGMLGLHASFTLTDDTLKKASRLAEDIDCGCHIHCAEADSDERDSIKRYKMRVVQRLDRFGILNKKGILAHCVHIDKSEMRLIARRDCNVAHNPQSNLNNAVGIADIIKMSDYGIRVLLGTDAMTVNMPEEMRVALWAQHLRHNNPSSGFLEIASTLLFNNPDFASEHFGVRLGELSEGAAADVILIDYLPPTPLNNSTVLGHIIYGISEEIVDTTIVGGRILYHKKRLRLKIDEEEISRMSTRLATRLWQRF